MKKYTEIELIPAHPGHQLFTPEEYEEYKEWWQKVVVPLIDKQPQSIRFFAG